MNRLNIITLKALRKSYRSLFNTEKKLDCIEDAQIASDLIVKQLTSDEPCMIARFGGFELATIVNYLGVTNQNKNWLRYIKSEEADWYWNPRTLNFMHTNAGFFPINEEKITQFCKLMIRDSKEVNILGSWIEDENFMAQFMKDEKIHLRFLEPFWTETPWTKALEGKKVLVVHPFAKTILAQYEKRELLFKNKDTLPKFQSLTVIKAVQSLGGNDDRFEDWFEALEYMKSQIDSIDYDVCLIGAGAYGFPLAAHVKRMGKQGLHIGGALQLFFGIRGKRWEDPQYGVPQWGIMREFYSTMMNEHWVRPNEDEKPTVANNVEGACYW